MVIAKSFARIHRMNLVNFGILPVIFSDPSVYDQLELNDVVVMENARELLRGNFAGHFAAFRAHLEAHGYQVWARNCMSHEVRPRSAIRGNGGEPCGDVGTGKGRTLMAIRAGDVPPRIAHSDG